jgi:hypothetical protein
LAVRISSVTALTSREEFFANAARFDFNRSVSKVPGSRLLIVTLCSAVERANPATKPVRPVRAPFDNASIATGAFTACDVTLTMRPNFRAIMPSSVALIRAIGASMLPSSALIQSSRSNFRPPALLTRISGAGQAARMASRPSFVVTSAMTVLGRLPVADAISSAALSRTSPRRAAIKRVTPSRASAIALALPSP